MKNRTARQEEYMAFLKAYAKDHGGHLPSQVEGADALGVNVGAYNTMLKTLIVRGDLKKIRHGIYEMKG